MIAGALTTFLDPEASLTIGASHKVMEHKSRRLVSDNCTALCGLGHSLQDFLSV